MKIKKIIALAAVCTLVGGNLIPITASAHGGGHHNGSRGTTVCTIKNCHKTGSHTHNGTSYGSRCSAYGHDHN